MTITESGLNPDERSEHRQRMRAQGLRPIEIWVPDVSSQHFSSEAHRQSLEVAQSEQEYDDQAFIDAQAAWNDA